MYIKLAIKLLFELRKLLNLDLRIKDKNLKLYLKEIDHIIELLIHGDDKCEYYHDTDSKRG